MRLDWQYLDLENSADYALLSEGPVLYFKQFDREIIFYEAQAYPQLFNVLRGLLPKDDDFISRRWMDSYYLNYIKHDVA